MIDIRPALKESEIGQAKLLFTEFLQSIGFDASQRLKNYPKEFQHSGGGVFIAMNNKTAVGAVGMVCLESRICEVRLLFVQPEYRGLKIGRLLMERVLATAKENDCKCVRLYTLPRLKVAIVLYKAMGFVEIEPYKQGMLPETVFMERNLGEEVGPANLREPKRLPR